MSKFISVADERVQCAAIIEGRTANPWPIKLGLWEPLGPSDVEQNLFPAAVYGIDNVDLHGAFSLILKKQVDLPPSRPLPRTPAGRATYAREIRDRVGRLLRFQKSDQPLNPRHVVTTPREGYKIEKVQFLSEPGIYIPAWVFIPDNRSGNLPTVLYVSDEGVGAEGMEFEGEEGSGLTHGVLDTLVRKGNLVVAVDVRGIGETRPPHCAESAGREFGQLFDVETAMAYMAWFMDQSLLGMRMQDVVRSVDYIMSRRDADSGHVRVIGKGKTDLETPEHYLGLLRAFDSFSREPQPY